MKRFLFASCLGLIALGCNKDKPADATPTASAAPAASAAPEAPAASAAAADTAPAAPAAADTTPVAPAVVAAVPAEEDFEPQAATTITAANATAQLTELEKEIAK
jgi:hypothetical protein